MPEEETGFDIYADAFTITITPFGANLSFSLREAHPSPNRMPQLKQLGTVRMSVEHLKTMVVILKRQVAQMELQTGVNAEVPIEILNQMGVPPEDWQQFWR